MAYCSRDWRKILYSNGKNFSSSNQEKGQMKRDPQVDQTQFSVVSLKRGLSIDFKNEDIQRKQIWKLIEKNRNTLTIK